MRILHLTTCSGPRGRLSATDFQPNCAANSILRLATSGGTQVQIWALYPGEDGDIKVKLLFTFASHSPFEVSTVRWSPNGRFLASTDAGGIVHILEKNDQKTQIIDDFLAAKAKNQEYDLPKEVVQVRKVKYDATESEDAHAITPGGAVKVRRISTLGAKNGNTTTVVESSISKELSKLLNPDAKDKNLELYDTLGPISCPTYMGQWFDISWAPDNRTLVCGGINGQVCAIDIFTREMVARFDAVDDGYIKSVAWDPMTLHVAVQSSTREISLWRRSAPLKPSNAPLKWSFERVDCNDDHGYLVATSDKLASSRISWSPNGRYIAFPNASAGEREFALMFRVLHYPKDPEKPLHASNKYELLYRFDMGSHIVEHDPLLFRGHLSRIRHTKFCSGIFKPTKRARSDVFGPYDKAMLYAQSSDDNVLSVWRLVEPVSHAVNRNMTSASSNGANVSIDCLVVLSNLLDEQSSIEDIAWGNQGKWLAVAPSQGGLVLIEFAKDELGGNMYQDWAMGVGLESVSEPNLSSLDFSVDVATTATSASTPNAQPDVILDVATASQVSLASYALVVALVQAVLAFRKPKIIRVPCASGYRIAACTNRCLRLVGLGPNDSFGPTHHEWYNYELVGGVPDDIECTDLARCNLNFGSDFITTCSNRAASTTTASTNSIAHVSSRNVASTKSRGNSSACIWLDMDYGTNNPFMDAYYSGAPGPSQEPVKRALYISPHAASVVNGHTFPNPRQLEPPTLQSQQVPAPPYSNEKSATVATSTRRRGSCEYFNISPIEPMLLVDVGQSADDLAVDATDFASTNNEGAVIAFNFDSKCTLSRVKDHHQNSGDYSQSLHPQSSYIFSWMHTFNGLTTHLEAIPKLGLIVALIAIKGPNPSSSTTYAANGGTSTSGLKRKRPIQGPCTVGATIVCASSGKVLVSNFQISSEPIAMVSFVEHGNFVFLCTTSASMRVALYLVDDSSQPCISLLHEWSLANVSNVVADFLQANPILQVQLLRVGFASKCGATLKDLQSTIRLVFESFGKSLVLTPIYKPWVIDHGRDLTNKTPINVNQDVNFFTMLNASLKSACESVSNSRKEQDDDLVDEDDKRELQRMTAALILGQTSRYMLLLTRYIRRLIGEIDLESLFLVVMHIASDELDPSNEPGPFDNLSRLGINRVVVLQQMVLPWLDAISNLSSANNPFKNAAIAGNNAGVSSPPPQKQGAFLDTEYKTCLCKCTFCDGHTCPLWDAAVVYVTAKPTRMESRLANLVENVKMSISRFSDASATLSSVLVVERVSSSVFVGCGDKLEPSSDC